MKQQWYSIVIRPEHVRRYYRVKDTNGNEGIAFLNTNRTWTLISGGCGRQLQSWAHMVVEDGWERLKAYMKDHSNEHLQDDWTVADGYYVVYDGRPMVGRTDGSLVTEDVWGSHEYHDIRYIDWSNIEVFTRKEMW